MTIRDISLRKRLLIGNFLMILVPVILLASMGRLIFLGFRFVDTGQRSELISTLWTEKGSELSIQFAVSSIKVYAEKGDRLKLKKILSACQILEAQGMSVLISRGKKILYLSANADAEFLRQKISERGIGSSMLLWDENVFALRYTSKKHGATIIAVGDVPFTSHADESAFPLKKNVEVAGIFLLTLTIIFIILLGRYLSKLLSRQILEPLKNLREVAEKIRSGKPDVSLNIVAYDEIGETCRDFELMRRELLSNKILREKYERSRKELIAGISHDLATPLTALKGYASGILDGIADTPEKNSITSNESIRPSTAWRIWLKVCFCSRSRTLDASNSTLSP